MIFALDERQQESSPAGKATKAWGRRGALRRSIPRPVSSHRAEAY
jgi:hypothetical protein